MRPGLRAARARKKYGPTSSPTLPTRPIHQKSRESLPNRRDRHTRLGCSAGENDHDGCTLALNQFVAGVLWIIAVPATNEIALDTDVVVAGKVSIVYGAELVGKVFGGSLVGGDDGLDLGLNLRSRSSGGEEREDQSEEAGDEHDCGG